mmetsp:Transcript_63349/g.151142  ORF Transcript_63349/g.151142 Transcript_63349/m.151142 type:complete len:183 (+) Transcript_63349:145-693(+)
MAKRLQVLDQALASCKRAKFLSIEVLEVDRILRRRSYSEQDTALALPTGRCKQRRILVQEHAFGSCHSINLFVRHFSGKTVVLTVCPEESVHSLKLRIEAISRVPVECFYLSLGFKVLAERKLISDYHLSDGATCCMRLRPHIMKPHTDVDEDLQTRMSETFCESVFHRHAESCLSDDDNIM